MRARFPYEALEGSVSDVAPRRNASEILPDPQAALAVGSRVWERWVTQGCGAPREVRLPSSRHDPRPASCVVPESATACSVIVGGVPNSLCSPILRVA